MTVAEIVEALGDAVSSVVGSTSPEIVAVTHDSGAATHGTLFACLPGDRVDGHDYAATAVEGGASAILVDHILDESVVGAATQIVVDDTRRRLGPIAATIFGSPADELIAVGITGTNGKTTTSLMLASIFEAAQWPTGVIGTLSGPRTTPEAPDLQRTLAEFVEDGCRAAVLEVSSHALALHRVDGTRFAAVVFTNFGRDHLDLHGTPEEYFRAKASLFVGEFAPVGVINVDDTHGRLLADTVALDVAAATAEAAPFRVVPYSRDDVSDVEVRPDSLSYTWRGHRIDVGIGGDFNVANSLAALVTAVELGVDVRDAAQGLRQLETVPGRFETVKTIPNLLNGDDSPTFTVIVDYAHTPDGLAEVAASARRVIADDRKVIIVFGCGGDRDQAKRPDMGRVAAELADRVVVTSDNPRSEDPQQIVNDIIGGIDAHYVQRVTSNVDRRAAIGEAIGLAGDGDIVVIAGKGHEQTQDLGSTTVEFDDRAVARSFLTARTQAARTEEST